VTSDEVDLGRGPGSRDRVADLGSLARVRLRVESTGEEPVFVGIARRDDVDRYLRGVGFAQVEHVRFDPFSVDYRYRDGGPPPTAPINTDIWVASAHGSGAQTLEWDLQSGQWSVVVMNADGSAGVSVDASAGARASWVLPVGIGLLAGGLLVVAIGG